MVLLINLYDIFAGGTSTYTKTTVVGWSALQTQSLSRRNFNFKIFTRLLWEWFFLPFCLPTITTKNIFNSGSCSLGQMLILHFFRNNFVVQICFNFLMEYLFVQVYTLMLFDILFFILRRKYIQTYLLELHSLDRVAGIVWFRATWYFCRLYF